MEYVILYLDIKAAQKPMVVSVALDIPFDLYQSGSLNLVVVE